MGKFYVVWTGRAPGVYEDWGEAKAQIDGYQNARYKGFKSREEAEEAFRAGPKPMGQVMKERVADALVDPSSAPIIKAIAVDAACSGNPGVMEYRGVSLWDNKEIFHHKYELGTNNIGEFLAIVEGLARLKQANAEDVAIYTDSMIALTWVRAKQCRSKLVETPRTSELLGVVRRAENWLNSNSYRVKILKWETKVWGEIPADFGRKK